MPQSSCTKEPNRTVTRMTQNITLKPLLVGKGFLTNYTSHENANGLPQSTFVARPGGEARKIVESLCTGSYSQMFCREAAEMSGKS